MRRGQPQDLFSSGLQLLQQLRLLLLKLGVGEHAMPAQGGELLKQHRRIGDQPPPPALLIIGVLRKKAPKAPGVLIAVVLTTSVSWWIGFDRSATLKIAEITDPALRARLIEYVATETRTVQLQLPVAVEEQLAQRRDGHPGKPGIHRGPAFREAGEGPQRIAASGKRPDQQCDAGDERHDSGALPEAPPARSGCG